jgi:hypothetical protein
VTPTATAAPAGYPGISRARWPSASGFIAGVPFDAVLGLPVTVGRRHFAGGGRVRLHHGHLQAAHGADVQSSALQTPATDFNIPGLLDGQVTGMDVLDPTEGNINHSPVADPTKLTEMFGFAESTPVDIRNTVVESN